MALSELLKKISNGMDNKDKKIYMNYCIMSDGSSHNSLTPYQLSSLKSKTGRIKNAYFYSLQAHPEADWFSVTSSIDYNPFSSKSSNEKTDYMLMLKVVDYYGKEYSISVVTMDNMHSIFDEMKLSENIKEKSLVSILNDIKEKKLSMRTDNNGNVYAFSVK